jgi:hypothetical protein
MGFKVTGGAGILFTFLFFRIFYSLFLFFITSHFFIRSHFLSFRIFSVGALQKFSGRPRPYRRRARVMP